MKVPRVFTAVSSLPPSQHLHHRLFEKPSFLQQERFQLLGESSAEMRCCQTLQYQSHLNMLRNRNEIQVVSLEGFCQLQKATACPGGLIFRKMVRNVWAFNDKARLCQEGPKSPGTKFIRGKEMLSLLFTNWRLFSLKLPDINTP